MKDYYIWLSTLPEFVVYYGPPPSDWPEVDTSGVELMPSGCVVYSRLSLNDGERMQTLSLANGLRLGLSGGMSASELGLTPQLI